LKVALKKSGKQLSLQVLLKKVVSMGDCEELSNGLKTTRVPWYRTDSTLALIEYHRDLSFIHKTRLSFRFLCLFFPEECALRTIRHNNIMHAMIGISPFHCTCVWFNEHQYCEVFLAALSITESITSARVVKTILCDAHKMALLSHELGSPLFLALLSRYLAKNFLKRRCASARPGSVSMTDLALPAGSVMYPF
jgi:hypothetical protein